VSTIIVPELAALEWERAWERDAQEQVIIVDEHDAAIGTADKLEAHRSGQLHRAFSILLFNAKKELLLQRRAAGKYHFARRWSNTCCGHPRPEETIADAAQRRLQEEFGILAPLSEQTQFIYRAKDADSGLIEHEYLHMFYGVYAGAPQPEPSEIGAWRWMAIPKIQRALHAQPQWFTPWFHLLIGQLFINDPADFIPTL
jgi:isopentenyl-diphosphate Delta-isomerase